MHRSLNPLLFLAAVCAGMAARAAVWTGTDWDGAGQDFRVTGVWVGGAAVSGATSLRKTAAVAGQPAVGPRQFTAHYFVRPGFHQSYGNGAAGNAPGTDQDFSFSLPSGCLQVSVPAGTFSAPYVLSAVVPGFLPDVVSRVSRLNPTAVSLELAVAPTMTPRKALAVTACYRDQDISGAVEAHLKLAYFPDAGDLWVPLPSSIDADNNRAGAASAHLGLWRLVELVPSGGLDAAAVYPNPLTPGRGVMTFSNLPAGARLRVYSFAGRKVRELVTDAAGQAQWNGANDGGETVASGTYFVFIEGAGADRTLKVQVQR